jgi:hypothetical protein
LLVASAMLGLVLGAPGRAETGCAGNDDAGPAKILFRDELAEIAIDCALFQTGPTHRLFIGIRISNTAARPIGVALGKPFDVIYPIRRASRAEIIARSSMRDVA